MRILALAIWLAVGSALPTAAQTIEAAPVVTITGVGSYSAKPDYAVFTAIVSSSHRDAGSAAAMHREKTQKVEEVIASLKSDGVTVARTGFTFRMKKVGRMHDRYGRWALGDEERYFATTTFIIEARKMEALSRIADRLGESWLVRLDDLSFHTDSPREAQHEARAAAIQDAREQAVAYARAAGIQLSETVEITDDETTRGKLAACAPPRKMDPAADGRITNIVVPTSLTFTARVNMVWRIAPR